DLRRTAVRNLERAGVSRSAAMKLTGHLTESIYRRYAIMDAGMLREAAVKLAAHHALEDRSHTMTPGEIERIALRVTPNDPSLIPLSMSAGGGTPRKTQEDIDSIGAEGGT